MLARADAIDGWMSIPELEWLGKMGAGPKRIVEVGSHKGRSTFALASSNAGVVYAVDLWPNPSVLTCFESNMAPELTRRVIPVRMTSVDASVTLPGEFDFIFVDADHSYDQVMSDLCSWTPRVKKGGVIAGHDYDGFWPGVIQALDEVFGTTVQRGPGSIWFVDI
jgi:predicted O-methyltransferase YrrM